MVAHQWTVMCRPIWCDVTSHEGQVSRHVSHRVTCHHVLCCFTSYMTSHVSHVTSRLMTRHVTSCVTSHVASHLTWCVVSRSVTIRRLTLPRTSRSVTYHVSGSGSHNQIVTDVRVGGALGGAGGAGGPADRMLILIVGTAGIACLVIATILVCFWGCVATAPVATTSAVSVSIATTYAGQENRVSCCHSHRSPC